MKWVLSAFASVLFIVASSDVCAQEGVAKAHIVGADCSLSKTGDQAGMSAPFTSFITQIADDGVVTVTVYNGPRNPVLSSQSLLLVGTGTAHRVNGYPSRSFESVLVKLSPELKTFFKRPTLVISSKVVNASDELPTLTNFLSDAMSDASDIQLKCYPYLSSTEDTLNQLPAGVERVSHPSICSIQFKDPRHGTGTWTHGCTASVIGSTTLLTAAHCQESFSSLKDTRVICGEAGQPQMISRWTSNPAFRPSDHPVYNPADASIIELTSQVGAPTLDVASNEADTLESFLTNRSQNCFHLGMGHRPDGSIGVLHRAPYRYPHAALGGEALVSYLLKKSRLLASDPEIFSREGDSGGPVICKINGRETIMAVHSFNSLASIEAFSAPTYVSFDFIKRFIGR